MIPLSHLSFSQGGQVKCRPKTKVIIKVHVSHSVVAEGTVVCVWGGVVGVQRPSGMTGISAILFDLNNFTVSNKA